MGRKKSYDKAEVVGKAKELFWKKGYEGAHLQELVQVTGLNRFSLYNEFGGKDGLFLASIQNYLDESDEAYGQTLGLEPAGLENIRTYFKKIRFGDDYEGCFFVNTLSEKHVIESQAYQLVQDFATKVEDMFYKNLTAAQKTGELSQDQDPRALARFFTINDLGLSVFGIVAPRTKNMNAIRDLILGVLE